MARDDETQDRFKNKDTAGTHTCTACHEQFATDPVAGTNVVRVLGEETENVRWRSRCPRCGTVE